ncbi:MAG TPA: L,D-transpeptidase family protein [Trebonia sp.]|nr:L,D-transpeptidase family protein [Trebonia sp.]
MGRVSGTLLRHRLIAATAASAAAVIVAGCAFAATSSGTGKEKLVSEGNTKKTAPTASASPTPTPVGPLTLLSVSPVGGTHDANGGAPITLTFSSALSQDTPLPKLSPKIPGSWQVSGDTATFTPASGFLPDTAVTLKIPASMTGADASAGTLAKGSTVRFKTGTYSVLRLQQILAQLGYLPLTWTASASDSTADGASASIPADAPAAAGTGSATAGLNQQVADAYQPPAGTFTFQSGYPTELTSQWTVGKDNMLDNGAIRAFQSVEGLTMDGVAGPDVWSHLLKAAAKHKVNPNGYTYALANQHSPESLTVWHNGKVIEHTLANTGIPGRNTQDGTFPVYLRYQENYMDGTNPDGSKYHDLVQWISYFNGGDAVHYFARYSYGYYQSLGCVEVPYAPAKKVWGYMTYGTLVTVIGPEA